MGRDAGWGGERQHPNLEHLSLASSVRSSVCPDSSMFTSSMEFGDRSIMYSYVFKKFQIFENFVRYLSAIDS